MTSRFTTRGIGNIKPVRMPVVAFTGTLTRNVNLGPKQPVVYDKILMNVGGGYNSKSGHFKAPVSGIYSVSASVLAHNKNHALLEIVKEGKEIVTLWAHNKDRSELATQSIYMPLRRGEAVWVRRTKSRYYGANLIAGLPYNSFSVALLSAGKY